MGRGMRSEPRQALFKKDHQDLTHGGSNKDMVSPAEMLAMVRLGEPMLNSYKIVPDPPTPTNPVGRVMSPKYARRSLSQFGRDATPRP
eukprot:5804788-Karenia_brevis.AAC.1